MNEIQQAQLTVLALRENLKEAEERLAFLRGREAGRAEKAEMEKEEKLKAEAEREEKLRAAKASLAAVKANRTRRAKAEAAKGE